jgi:cytochrome c biogenesis protein CcmG/thiol:disulfide interchange protein DsbE
VTEPPAATSPAAERPPGDGPSPPPPPPARRPRPIFLLVGIVLAAGLGVGLFTSFGSSPTNGQLEVGAPAPHFLLPALSGGGRVGLPADGGGSGHPAVVLFFASWCTPCHAELPALARTYRQQQSSHSRLAGVALIGVDTADPQPNAVAFVKSSGVTFPVAADTQYAVIDRYDFVGDPDAVFVNADGTIAGVKQGALSAASLVSWEHRLLANA